MASNSATPNEGGSRDDDNNSQERNKNAATWKLLTKYIDRFVKEEDYNEYTNIIQQATGASDEVIARAIRFRNSPYSQKPKTTTTQVTNAANPWTVASGEHGYNNNKKKKSNAGRPTGGTGGGPGGNRYHADFVNPDDGRMNRRLSDYNNNAGDGGNDSNGVLDMHDGDIQMQNERNKAEENKRKAEAVEALKKYANSFKNGTMDNDMATVEDSSDIDDGDDSGILVEDVEEGSSDNTTIASASGNRQQNNKNHNNNHHTYQPQEGSAVLEYLNAVLRDVRKDDDPLGIGKGRAWIPPDINPMSKSLGPEANPNQFYVGNTWVFVWHPMKQFKHYMPNKFQCIRCKSCDNTTINRWGIRPFHWWDKTVHVLYQWVRCSTCRVCFPTVGPKCLATLPTPITEQFPFMLPNLRGPGIYSQMITLLTLLMPHSILFGTFSRVFNSLRCINFAQSHASYLSSVLHWLKNPPAIVSSKIPTPFSPRLDQMGYCGLNINVPFVKSCLRLFMQVSGPYMQAAFQLANDEGASSDDSYKFTKHVVVSVKGKKVHLFTGVYSCLALSGKPVVSVFTYTKSPQELNEVIPDWSAVRRNVGQDELLRLEGDNAAGDSAQQLSSNPSLLKEVVPYRVQSDLPRFEVNANDYVYVHTREGLERYALALVDHAARLINETGCCRIGLDIEFDEHGITQISIAPEQYDKSLLIHPYQWGHRFEPTMKTILELSGVLIIGCNVVGDLHKLRREFGIQCTRVRDNRRYALFDNASQKTGLKDLAAAYLRLCVDKTHQRSNFRVHPPLAAHLQQYAVGDAILPPKIDEAITARLVGTTFGTHPPDLQPNAEIIVKSGGKDAAKAILRFLGECGNDNGESQMWGTLYVGKGKALVKIVSVIAPGLKLPYCQDGWGPNRRWTYGDVFDVCPDGIIAVKASQIHRRLTLSTSTAPDNNGMPPNNSNNNSAKAAEDTNDTTTATHATTTTNDTTTATHATTTTTTTDNTAEDTTGDTTNKESSNDKSGSTVCKEVAEEDEDNCIERVDDSAPDGNEEDDVVIRSREKSDIWHEFDGMTKLMRRNCPATPYMHQLLRAATMSINEREENRIKYVLTSKGIVNHADHFFYNREYWLRRMRMPPRSGSKASANLLAVIDFFKREDAFSEYITPEIEKFIRGWALRCLSGRYEELPDVDMYTHNGVDSDGLDIWLRRRGSRAENLHQKMNASVGPMGIGAETAHNLQVLVLYEYLVNTGITRCGEPDFGHTHHWLEDRIQSQISEIYGVELYPNRVNVSEYKPLDFIAVGVSRLCLNEDYVDKGEPGDSLTGDLRWVAQQQGLKYPPLPPSTKEEFAMIRQFCKDHPKPTRSDIHTLCKSFKARSNGIDIFPKLPTMILPAIARWKINQAMKALKLKAGASYDQFFEKLNSEKVNLPPPSSSQRIESRRGIQQNKSYHKAQSEDALVEDTSMPTRLPPTHVPPINAPAQVATIPPVSDIERSKFQRCVFWPMCESDARVCGGIRVETCNLYGMNGTQETPPMNEVIHQRRLRDWSRQACIQDCAWVCCGKAILCGGLTKEKCSKYGKNGTHVDSRPTEEEMVKAKRVKEAARQRARRAQNMFKT